MAAGFHERKVNGDICPMLKNFELSEMNHLPLANHSISVFSNFKMSFNGYFLQIMINRKQVNKFLHDDPYLRQCKFQFSFFVFLIIVII